jgi:hypothetical protein
MSMPSPFVKRLLPLVTLVALVAAGQRASAQVPPPDPTPLDCGPIRVNVDDFVAFNVGNPARPPESPTVLLVRLANPDGDAVLERQLTLSPGQSQSVRWTAVSADHARQVLVRGEVIVLSGPIRVIGTLQVFGRDLTYGPHAICSGDTGTKGPA